jgi:hypothetical protein
VLAADGRVDESGIGAVCTAGPIGSAGQAVRELAHEELVGELRLLVRPQADVDARVGDSGGIERHAVMRV